jgi:hypothetical protein
MMTIGAGNRGVTLTTMQEFGIVEIVSLRQGRKGKRKKAKGKNKDVEDSYASEIS